MVDYCRAPQDKSVAHSVDRLQVKLVVCLDRNKRMFLRSTASTIALSKVCIK